MVREGKGQSTNSEEQDRFGQDEDRQDRIRTYRMGQDRDRIDLK
jgi:hypothetical protein